jgi:hypothetical protein
LQTVWSNNVASQRYTVTLSLNRGNRKRTLWWLKPRGVSEARDHGDVDAIALGNRGQVSPEARRLIPERVTERAK